MSDKENNVSAFQGNLQVANDVFYLARILEIIKDGILKGFFDAHLNFLEL